MFFFTHDARKKHSDIYSGKELLKMQVKLTKKRQPTNGKIKDLNGKEGKIRVTQLSRSYRKVAHCLLGIASN